MQVLPVEPVRASESLTPDRRSVFSARWSRIFSAGVACAGEVRRVAPTDAEGATAPETLRQKDRARH